VISSGSRTAAIVAGARALGGVDPVASKLVPRPLALALSVRPLGRVLRVATLGLVEHLSIRTRAIDAVVARGGPQLVVLGAGLDARAYRMHELADTVVYEVDHPATQAAKRERAAVLERTARAVVWVGVDFEHDDLAERLAASGHDAAKPTIWVWEGVTEYLTRAAIESTLEVVAARSSSGSRLVVTYGTPEMATVPSILRPIVDRAFRVLGEPLRGLMSPEEFGAIVAGHGFTIEDDAGMAELAERQGVRLPPIVITERVLVAQRT
jgi:methyltransferase (TIGR00027 family)